MVYRVQYEKNALKTLKKLDRYQRVLILSWIEKHLQGTDNPRFSGKALKGSLKDYWRYRVGQYRIIADIQDEKITIMIVAVGHRKDIYEK